MTLICLKHGLYAGDLLMEKTAIALPRSIGPQMSASTPGLLDNAAEQKVPVKNRPTSSPAKLFVKAHKKVKAKYPMNVM